MVRLRAGRAVPENPVVLEVRAGLEADPVGRDRVVQADRLLGDPAAAGGMPLTSRSAKALKGLTCPRMEKRSGQRTRTTGLSQSLRVAKKSAVQSIKVSTRSSNRLKFTPDGKFVFISDLGGRDLVVVDAVARKELKRIALGGGAAGILMQPDGSRAYVAVGSENGVTVIDLKTLEAAGHIETGPGPDGLGWAVMD